MKRIRSWFGFLVAFICIAVSGSSCGDDDEATAVDCDGTVVTFTEVNSIIQSSCAKNSTCHGTGSTHGPGSLLTYAQIYNARNEISRAVANGSMPQDRTLSSNQKNAILCWIENGASNN